MPDTAIDGLRHRRYPKWLWVVVAVPPIAAVVITQLAPEPHGHWTEHLADVAFKTVQLLVLAVLATLVSWRSGRPLLLVAVAIVAVVAVGIVIQASGSLQVARSIWRTSGDPGFGIGYAAGHDRSESGDLIVLLGGFVFAGLVGFGRLVPARLAVLAAVTAVIPPPFLWPAAGILVVLLYTLTSKATAATAKSAALFDSGP